LLGFALLNLAGVKVNGKYYWDTRQMLSAIRHVVGLSARQRTCESGAWHNRTPAASNTWFNFSRAMTTNSPDLNPVHYKISESCSAQREYEMQIHNVDELKQWLGDVWSGLQQSVVDAAVSEWEKQASV